MKELDQKNMLIGYKLRQLRTTRGYTQSKIAEFLGMSSQHYGTLERGINAFSLNNVMRLCNFYNVPVVNILGDIRKSDKTRRKESERLTSQIEELGDEHKEAVTHMVKFYRQLERKIGRQSQEEMEEELLKRIEEENELQQLAAAMQQQADEEKTQQPKKTRGRKSKRVSEQEALFKMLIGEVEFDTLNEQGQIANESSFIQDKQEPKKKSKKEVKEVAQKQTEDEQEELEQKNIDLKKMKPKKNGVKSKKKSQAKKKAKNKKK